MSQTNEVQGMMKNSNELSSTYIKTGINPKLLSAKNAEYPLMLLPDGLNNTQPLKLTTAKFLPLNK